MENKIVSSSYPELKCLALKSVQKHLVQNNNCKQYANAISHQYPHNHLNSHSFSHCHTYGKNDENHSTPTNGTDTSSVVSSSSSSSQQMSHQFVDYDISKLFLSFDDFNCVLNYWQYRFNQVDLVVGIEPSGLVLGSVFSQRLRLPFLMLKKRSSTNSSLSSSDGATTNLTLLREEIGSDDEELEVEQEILSTLFPSIKDSTSGFPFKSNEELDENGEKKKFQILIMDDLLENGTCLAAAIELIKKLLHQSKIKDFKILTTFISSIKSLGGKEKIYEMYNDISVDVINIIE
ncbi:hypothetical protein RB653_008325 [Dictyostelium firmibasis]|uniref:adenine phosphoribosyltransferase n=1 Tax=Dictyostelium firmibasis TaxID=79012 RepID=A0AAN7TYS5_9MYCE